MTQDWLSGALEGEDDKPEKQSLAAVAGDDALAAAVAAIAAQQGPQGAADAATFLEKQSRLLDLQAKHLAGEHQLRRHDLQGRLSEARLRRAGLRIRIAFQLFVAVVAAFVGAGVIVMLHDAFSTRTVVVEPFDAPPSLVARGVTGKVIAGGLLDQLGRLQRATRGDAAKRDLSNAWAGDIKLEVPEVGVSIGELSRLLKARFGHDTHINGELIETNSGGLALTVRGDGIAAQTFTGPAGDLGRLTTSAAEYVYAQSEPVLWAYYLNNRGRFEEAIAFSSTAFASADPADRPYLLNTWANALSSSVGSFRESLPLYRMALKLKPDYWVAHNNVMQSLWSLGDEEGAWRAGEETRRVAGGRPGRAPETYYQNWDVLTWNLGPWLDGLVADAEASGGAGTAVSAAGPMIADIQARRHDSDAADLAIKTTKIDPDDPASAAMIHFVRGRLALAAGNVALATTEMEAFGVAYANPAVGAQIPGYACWIALAEEAAGRLDKADAVLKSGDTFVDCYRFRGDILEGRGDWAGAQQAYADAVALAPDLPAAYYSWGVALARHGDLAGAEAKLKDANLRGPHWADPLKAWGDVLIKQGRRKEALGKYDDALKFAPAWAALKAAREAAAKPAA